jgi:molybdopterin converting factor small subunit
MNTQKGIWIDKKKALIVTLKDGKEESREVFESDVVTRERIEGESKTFGRFGDQFLNEERKKEAREELQIKDFLDELSEKLRDADEIVIFGPAEMKTELRKHMEKDHRLSIKIRGVESADSMTDNQIAAWVRDYFNN